MSVYAQNLAEWMDIRVRCTADAEPGFYMAVAVAENLPAGTRIMAVARSRSPRFASVYALQELADLLAGHER